MQRIPESCCVRKETVDIDLPTTSDNGDRKIMKPVKIMSRPATRMRKWNQFNHFK